MVLRIGGCSRQDLLMKQPLNFIDAPNVITLGATTHSLQYSKNIYHTPFLYIITLAYVGDMLPANRDQYFLQGSRIMMHSSII
jgi:hypothetical protein